MLNVFTYFEYYMIISKLFIIQRFL